MPRLQVSSERRPLRAPLRAAPPWSIGTAGQSFARPAAKGRSATLAASSTNSWAGVPLLTGRDRAWARFDQFVCGVGRIRPGKRPSQGWRVRVGSTKHGLASTTSGVASTDFGPHLPNLARLQTSFARGRTKRGELRSSPLVGPPCAMARARHSSLAMGRPCLSLYNLELVQTTRSLLKTDSQRGRRRRRRSPPTNTRN